MKALNYRHDIDGLRAIAVLSIIIFHIDESLLPGGFVGVDIFFVISGYLITLHILRDLNEGRFSILEFYKKRVKRIIPAMLAVVLLTLLLAQLILLPKDAEKVAESGLWSLFSLANVYFWLFEDTSYFAAASNEKPLLHLWSLGVEEQFYIFWPLILLLAYKFGHNKGFLYICSIFIVISILLGELIYSYDSSFAYYMLPTRAGELLIGGILAHFILQRQSIQVPKLLLTLLSLSGASLLFGSLILLTAHEVFPGIRSIPPTLGTALLIFTGHYGKPSLNRTFEWQPLVWIGTISYSAYLWHWPILAFYRYGYSDITLMVGIIIFALTILLAWLSYLYIELPFRRSKKPAISIIAGQYIAPSCCIALMAIAFMKIDGYGIRWFSHDYKEKVMILRDAHRPAYQYEYVCQTQLITQQDINNHNCIVGSGSNEKPQVILWGDSNAAHYIGVLGAFAEKKGFKFRNLQIGSCPPLNIDSTGYTSVGRVADCNNSRQISLDALNQYRIIIISASWSAYQSHSETFLNAFYNTVQSLLKNNKKVILIGKAPIINSFDRYCREKAISFPFLICDESAVPLDEKVSEINKLLKEFSNRTENVEYYDFNHYLCPNNLCSPRNKNGELIYYDSSHLTLTASWKIGRQIVEKDGVPFPFDSINNWIDINKDP